VDDGTGLPLNVAGSINSMRSVSMGPSTTYETRHLYFAQTGHSHFAATIVPREVGIPSAA
jgi:hypothetical protein